MFLQLTVKNNPHASFFLIHFHEAWGFWNLLEPGEVFLTVRCTARKLTGWSLVHSPAGCQWYCLYLYSTFVSKCTLLFYIPESTLLTWSQFPDPFLQCCGLPQSRVFRRTAIFDLAHVIDCGTSFLHQMALLWKLCGCERCPGFLSLSWFILTFVLVSSTSACVSSFSKCSFTKSLQHFRLHAKGWQYKGKWKMTMFIFCLIDRTCRKFRKITPFLFVVW